jgi:hypothetical protein
MIEVLTRRFRVVCDRCGKEWQADETQTSSGLFPVVFAEEDAALIYGKRMARGGVCEECYNDFREIAENFFDEVNRRATDERV